MKIDKKEVKKLMFGLIYNAGSNGFDESKFCADNELTKIPPIF
eukprot:COSAG02_NODE_505_length_20935_cov_38.509119_21_plen_43_part_00